MPRQCVVLIKFYTRIIHHIFVFNSKLQHRIFGEYICNLFSTILNAFSRYDICLLIVFCVDRSEPPDLAPIQEIDRDLCDPDKLRTVEKLVDDLSVALSQHFPRMWSC